MKFVDREIVSVVWSHGSHIMSSASVPEHHNKYKKYVHEYIMADLLTGVSKYGGSLQRFWLGVGSICWVQITNKKTTLVFRIETEIVFDLKWES